MTTRGILRPEAGLRHFDLDRAPPPDDLAPFVEALWTVRWALDPATPFAQEILPFPCVNLACEEPSFAADADETQQARGFYAHGPGTRRFVAELTGEGWVAGVRFRPAGFFAFAALPMKALLDRVVPAEEAMGRAPPPAPDTPEAGRAALVAYLRSFELPAPDPELLEVNALVDRAQADRTVARADDLARAAGLSVRSLHRRLERYVGVSSKWIVRRARVQDAAERVARGEPVEWAAVAQELGYHDQAHLVRDFKAQLGFTPAAYAKRCAEAREG